MTGPVGGGHLDGRAEHELGQGHGHVDEEVGLVAREEGVGAHRSRR